MKPYKPYTLKLSNAEYHARPELSSTGLKELAKSPAHYQNYICSDRTATPAMILGSYVHSLILEPEIANSEYIVAPEGMAFNTKDGKLWKSENEGKQIIKFDDDIMAQQMKSQVNNSALCQGLLSMGGEAETSIFWEDDETGIDCKCRPDYINHDLKMIIDLKTTSDASAKEFTRQSWNMNYHLQASFYQRGVMALYGSWYQFLIIAIEKDNPYLEPVVYNLDNELLARGDEKVNKLLKIYSECCATNVWNGYSTEIETLSAPAWAE